MLCSFKFKKVNLFFCLEALYLCVSIMSVCAFARYMHVWCVMQNVCCVCTWQGHSDSRLGFLELLHDLDHGYACHVVPLATVAWVCNFVPFSMSG